MKGVKVLIIKLKPGSKIRLFDKENSVELGEITRLAPQPNHQHEVLFGFAFPDNIKILRDSLINGKDTNGNQQT